MKLGNFTLPDSIPDVPRTLLSDKWAPLVDMSSWSPMFYTLTKTVNAVVNGYRFPIGEGAAESLKRQGIKKNLLNKLKPDDTVYTVLRHRAASGMSRRISVFIAHNKRIEDITYKVSVLTHYKEHKREQGLVVRGCGMDMGFAVVYDLSQALDITLRQEWL